MILKILEELEKFGADHIVLGECELHRRWSVASAKKGAP